MDSVSKEEPTSNPEDELYEAPPDEFTRRRNALVKALKDEGDDQNAERIASLKRPTLPVWAINQLARRDPGGIAELIQVQQSLGGTDPQKLQQLSRRRRQLVATLTDQAGTLLREGGHSATSQTLERISKTLLAVNTPDEEELLRNGRLERELEARGFEEAFTELPSVQRGPDASVERSARADQKLKELGAQAREARAHAKTLAREATRLRHEAEAAEVEAETALRRADQLEKKAKAARARAKRA